ncbi:MAG: leucine-rich repeat domain-containing protein [Oscillospiraceae bacterium]|nr:leucine-rich repeat domain-containing protein [Oscillospiraceae bacterium]
MSEIIEKDGFIFELSDDGTATAELISDYPTNEVIVPTEVNGIPVKAFRVHFFLVEKKIKYLKIPAGVSRLVFGRNYNYATKIEIDENNPNYYSDGKAVYTKDRSKLICFLARDDEEYTIPSGCKRISASAFQGSPKLKRVFFPEGLESIGGMAFAKCVALEEFDLPEGLTEIKEFAFVECDSLKRITFPSTLEVIGVGAFEYCYSRLTVYLPAALREIREAALPNTWTLILSEENKSFISRNGVILSADGKKVLHHADPFGSSVVTIPDNATEIAPFVFSCNHVIEKVILPKTLHTIGNSAFVMAKNLREINLENVRELGDSAFRDCESLEKITLKCDKPGAISFLCCKNLIEAEVDCEITGAAMFDECESLQKVVLKHTKVISEQTFRKTPMLKEIVFPPELEIIEDVAFIACGISSLTIPKTVRRIGNNIAGKVREIHVYDNIETDINPDNDFSAGSYTLYVHSAETDELKYVVPNVGRDADLYHFHLLHIRITGMFKGRVSFDFKKLDSFFFSEMSDEYFVIEKVAVAKVRLKYGYELDEPTRRRYEEFLAKFGRAAAEKYIKYNDLEEAFDPLLYEYMSAEDMLSLVDLSAQNNLTELTAFLMQKLSEKKALS